MVCLRGIRVKQHTIAGASTTDKVFVTAPGQTEEEPGPEPPQSAQNIWSAPVSPQTGTSEQRRVKWPATNKEWLQLDVDIDKIMETVKGDVDDKLQVMCTLITTIGADRFGVTGRRENRQAARPNWRELNVCWLRQELKALKCQFRAAKEEERGALSELRQILRRKLITLGEWNGTEGEGEGQEAQGIH